MLVLNFMGYVGDISQQVVGDIRQEFRRESVDDGEVLVVNGLRGLSEKMQNKIVKGRILRS